MNDGEFDSSGFVNPSRNGVCERFRKETTREPATRHSSRITCHCSLVGLGRVELPTSPLSGVRSSHLSYRPNRHRKRVHAFELLVCEEFYQYRMRTFIAQVPSKRFSHAAYAGRSIFPDWPFSRRRNRIVFQVSGQYDFNPRRCAGK